MLAQKAWRMIRTLIFTYLVSGVLLTALAFALYKFRLPESQITLGISSVYILSCFMGGFMAGKAMRSRKFLWGLLTGILYFAFLLIMSFLQDASHHRRRRPAGHGLCHVLFKRHGRGDDQLTDRKRSAPLRFRSQGAVLIFCIYLFPTFAMA